MKLHLDTDFGGDPDDACALVMALGWPGAEVVGITTNLDPGGRRAGCVSAFLSLAGRDDIAVAAGAASTLTTLDLHESTWGDARYWPMEVPPQPAPPGAALDLLAQSIDAGATVVAIGAYTNLALLEILRPGTLAGAGVVVMGGFVGSLAENLPPWGPERDWNVQCDPRAAEIVAGATVVTFSTMSASITAQLRQRDLPRLRAAGPIGRLLAQQSTAYAADTRRAALVAEHPGLARDHVNFHWDPVAVAVALGWKGATLEDQRLAPTRRDGTLTFTPIHDGRPHRVLVRVDADAFTRDWLSAVEATDAAAR